LEVLESVFIFLFPVALVTSITATGIIVYLGAIVFISLLILKQKNRAIEQYFLNFSQLHIAFLIYIFTFTLTKFINSGVKSGFNICFSSCQDYFVLLWSVLFIAKSYKNQKLIKYAILTAAIISVVYGMLQLFHLDIFHRQVNVQRISGFHKNPYSYGGQLIVFFFFLLSWCKDKFNNIPRLVILTLCFICLLNTSERAVILGVVLGIVLYFSLEKIKINELPQIAFILIIPIFLTYVLNTKVIKRIRRTVLPVTGDKQNIRFRLWGIAIAIWKRNILFGAGKFPTVYRETVNGFPLKELTHAHNTYLQLLVTNGIIGTLAFLNLFLSMIRILLANLKVSKYSAGFLAILLSFFVEGFFEYFWGDSEVKYALLYFAGFVFGSLLESDTKECKI